MKHEVVFAALGSGMTIIFLMLVNYLTSPNHTWFLYPSFVLILWPVSLYFFRRNQYTIFVLFVGFVTILFLSVINYTETPGYPWILYAIFPIILWVILTFLGKHNKKMSTAILGSASTILYYAALNYYLSPGYPWVIYPAFVVLWWPLLLYCIKAKQYFRLSLYATLLTGVFFIIVRIVSTPDTIWEVYPIFVMLWWPLSMYFYGLHGKKNGAAVK
ncbi:hypothetical protein [Gracilibacillus alcaliphilus]|uniref:hypothetical protein n=1 Tax=Gracilibacillus alcaliphilus TaxID=1401441 RepID=UPI0019566997|nr:hypothetical protein [Gracilibacillus alcaliphilus]MBM7679332.1 hypothetical protein [Gracilibacillus alcaliphilus]